jgi:hypothetical protein
LAADFRRKCHHDFHHSRLSKPTAN